MKQPTLDEMELINIGSEIDKQLDEFRMPGDKESEQQLLRVLEEHRYALIHGTRTEEFDKIIAYLHFYRQPAWKKAATYATKGLGIVLGLILIAALLGVGY